MLNSVDATFTWPASSENGPANAPKRMDEPETSVLPPELSKPMHSTWSTAGKVATWESATTVFTHSLSKASPECCLNLSSETLST